MQCIIEHKREQQKSYSKDVSQEKKKWDYLQSDTGYNQDQQDRIHKGDFLVSFSWKWHGKNTAPELQML